MIFLCLSFEREFILNKFVYIRKTIKKYIYLVKKLLLSRDVVLSFF